MAASLSPYLAPRLYLLLALSSFCFLLAQSSTPAASSPPLRPHHIRIQHLWVDTHPHLFVDTQTPHFSWQIDAEQQSRRLTQIAYRLIVQPADGAAADSSLRWDTGRLESNKTSYVVYAGPRLSSDSVYTWTLQYWSSTGGVSEAVSGHFHTALMSMSDWKGDWIGSSAINMNQLRREFPVRQPLSRASLFVSGIGYCTLFINGVDVDESRKLDPGWTAYETRVLYTAFDVTSLLTASAGGAAGIGVNLGGGWYSQEQWADGLAPDTTILQPTYGPPYRLLLQLVLHYADGSNDTIVSDSHWMGRAGPMVHDGVYMGTVYDARLLRRNFSVAGFQDPLSLWLPASVLPSPLTHASGVISLQRMDPIRRGPQALHIETSAKGLDGRFHSGQPVGVIGGSLLQGGVFHPELVDGNFGPTFGLGQNLAGYCTANSTGPRSSRLQMIYGELLLSTGANGVGYQGVDKHNAQYIAVSDDYIRASQYEYELYEPEYTQHGFEYVQVYGFPTVSEESLVCYAIHSETTLMGNFTSNSTVLNQIQHIIVWSQLSNSQSLPTDCDNRNERRGWLGDAAYSCDEALFNLDYAAFYINFLQLIADAQDEYGAVPPQGHAYPTIAYRIWEHYGDLSPIRDHYEGIERWVETVTAGYNRTGLVQLHSDYGDWVAIDQATNPHLASSYAYLHDVLTFIDMSRLLGNDSNVRRYSAHYALLAKEFHSTFFNNNATHPGYADNLQSANVFALSLPGVVPDTLRDGVLHTLVSDIEQRDALYSEGFVSISLLWPLLSTSGHHDLAVHLATQTKYPSYGFMSSNAVHNSTTLWEDFRGFAAAPGGNSYNHHFLGSIGAWFYRYLAGIHPNAGRQLLIHPRLTHDASLLPAVNAEVVTIWGAVTVNVQRLDDGAQAARQRVRYTVGVPANVEATLRFDPTGAAAVCETVVLKDAVQTVWRRGAEQRLTADGEEPLLMQQDAETRVVSALLGSGRYEFEVQWLDSELAMSSA